MKRNHLVIWLLVLPAVLYSCRKGNRPPGAENKKARWITHAFTALAGGRYPAVKAISWWHENFDRSLLKINTSPESLTAYRDGVGASSFITVPNIHADKLVPADSGIYHSAFPDFGSTEDVVTTQRIAEFEALADKKIVWAYFSNNWYDRIRFPLSEVRAIDSAGCIPFIRMMPRTDFKAGGPDPNYTMQKIIDGKFDAELTQWAIDARNTHIPLLVEFGAEANGDWFPWNGQYNGAGETTGYGDSSLPDGPERFRDAYRHIIDICRANGAANITWFFHVNAYSEPDAAWNQLTYYYPGDRYIDWLGVSIYGPQESREPYQDFSEILDDVYPLLTQLSNKPIAIVEFAVTEME